MVDSEVRSWVFPTHCVFKLLLLVLLCYVIRGQVGCLCQTILNDSANFSSWIWLTESCTLSFILCYSLCLPFTYTFVVQLCWLSPRAFSLEAVCWLGLMVSFGFHALWISERSSVLFLKLSMFSVSAFCDSGGHMVEFRCLRVLEVVAVLTKVKWVLWSATTLLTLPWEMSKPTWEMMFLWQICGASERYSHTSEASKVLVSRVLSAGWLTNNWPLLMESCHDQLCTWSCD